MFLVPLLFTPLEDTKLRNEHIMSLDSLTDEQWDVFGTSWKFNIDVWDKKSQPFFTAAALFSYFTYFRWKHGPKIWKTIARIAAVPSKFPLLGPSSCNPRLCAEAPDMGPDEPVTSTEIGAEQNPPESARQTIGGPSRLSRLP